MRWACVKNNSCTQPQRAKKSICPKSPSLPQSSKQRPSSMCQSESPNTVLCSSDITISHLITYHTLLPYQQGKGSEKRRTPSERVHALLLCHYYPTLSWIDAKQFIKLIHGAPCSALCPRALRLRAFLLGASCFLLDVHTQAREGKEKSRKQILPSISLAQKTMTLLVLLD